MKSKILMFLGLLAVSIVPAHAALVTEVQQNTFTGPAGNSSGAGGGAASFAFNYFDSALGTLTGVHIRYKVDVTGGYLRADNMTNQSINGNATLGAMVSLDISKVSEFLNLQNIELTQQASFVLAADPSMTTGGFGSDVFQMYGSNLTQTKGWLNYTNNFLIDPFYDVNGSGGTFDVDFATYSLITLNAAGAQGVFEPASVKLTMELYYSYDAAVVEPEPTPEPTPGPAPVPAPLAGMFGLGLLGLGLAKRK